MQAFLALKSAAVRGGRRQAAPASRRTVVVPRAGLLDFFKPAPAAASKQNNSQRAKELVEQLLQVAGPTQAGDKASGAVRQQVAELVDELEQYCPRAPLRSPLLWGDYEVVYAARPGTIGGPFKSPVGRAVFPGLEASQTLQPPNVCINRVEYKTLGFIPGSSSQEGFFEPVDGNTFKLIFPQQDGKKPGGPRERLITISYLDEKIRVARFTPAEGDDASEPTFYVFTRKEEKPKPEPKAVPAPKAAPKPRGRAAAAVVEEEEEEAPAPKARGAFGTQLLRGAPKEGLATRVERSYYRNKGQEGTQEARGGTGTTRRAAGTGTTRRAASAPPASTQARGTQARGTAVSGRGTAAKEAAAPARPMTAQERAEAQKAALREREEARKAAAEARAQQLAEQREARERAVAEQRAARERAEAERKAAQERQAAERKAAAERAAAVRAQLAELTKEASDAQSEAQAAVKTLKEAEKELAPVLRAAAGAKSALEEAVAGAVAAASALGELKSEEKEAVRQVDVARKLVSKLESLGRSSK